MTLFHELITMMNQGISEFREEVRNQKRWNDVTIVMVSEFARTCVRIYEQDRIMVIKIDICTILRSDYYLTMKKINFSALIL